MCYTPADGVPGLSVSSCDRHVVEDRVTVALVGLSVMTWRSERSERHDIDLLFQRCVQVFKGKHGAAPGRTICFSYLMMANPFLSSEVMTRSTS